MDGREGGGVGLLTIIKTHGKVRFNYPGLCKSFLPYERKPVGTFEQNCTAGTGGFRA